VVTAEEHLSGSPISGGADPLTRGFAAVPGIMLRAKRMAIWARGQAPIHRSNGSAGPYMRLCSGDRQVSRLNCDYLPPCLTSGAT